MLRTVAIAAVVCGSVLPSTAKPRDTADQPLRAAIKAADPAKPATLTAAVAAIDQAVRQRAAPVLPELAALLARPVDKRLLPVQVAAATAIPKLAADPGAAVAALVPAIDHPFAVAKGELLANQLAVAGASVNALGELQDARALTPTLRLMYRAPPLATQVRRALVAYGPAAVDAIRKVLQGQHAEVEEVIKRDRLDQACDAGGACQQTSIRDFFAATVAGELGDPSLATELLRVIDAPALPAYVIDDQPGPSQHAAAFDALRKLAPASTAPALLAIVRDHRRDLADRVLAASTLGFVAVAIDGKALDALAAIAADNAADDGLRQAAADAVARLGTTTIQLQLMGQLARRYLDAAAKQRALIGPATDPRDAKRIGRTADAYVGFARMFQNHMARIAIAMTCKADQGCFADTLARGRADTVARMKRYIADVASWSEPDQTGLHEAAVERAMLELAKHGPIAPAVVDRLLDHVGTEVRLQREAILFALRRAAPRPCPTCVAKLDAVIERDRTKATLGELVVETVIVRNFLRWAK